VVSFRTHKFGLLIQQLTKSEQRSSTSSLVQW
jgi:hypothetical protein